MKCPVCGKPFRDGARVVPVLRYVTNERRGDFVGSQPEEFVHMSCMITG